MTGAERVAIGRIVRPQGRHGEVVVEPWSDSPERFPALRRALLKRPGAAERELAVEACRPHKGRFVLKLQGIDSIEAAETLRDCELSIDESELPALPPGSYYHHELVGLRVERRDGSLLGSVAGIWETGATAPVLIVRGDGGEQLLPLAAAYVEVDLARGRVLAELPESVEAEC